MTSYTRFTSRLWEIFLVGDEQGLSMLHMETGQGPRQFEVDPAWQRNDEMFAEAKTQVLEYLEGERTEFTIPLNPAGTPFQKQVWEELRRIPCGESRSYKDVAVALGKPSASRAIGMANSKNPIPIIIPCHRVVASSGKLAGFAHGVKAKQQLLNIENKQPYVLDFQI